MRRMLCLLVCTLLALSACAGEDARETTHPETRAHIAAAPPPTTARPTTVPPITTAPASTAPPTDIPTTAPLTLDERFGGSPYWPSEPIVPPQDAPMRDGLFVLSPYEITGFVNPDEYWDWNPDNPFPYDPAGEQYGYLEDFSEGCGWGCLTAAVIAAEASSTLPDEGNLSYAADNVLWNHRASAWVEGAPGYGIGESITVLQAYLPHSYDFYLHDLYGEDFDHFYMEREIPASYLEDSFQLTGMYIVNGYAKADALWAHNSRAKTLLMSINDEPYAYLELADTIMPQFFNLYQVSLHCGPAYRFRFEILEVYPGAIEDTCITGMGFSVEGISGGH